MLGGCCSWHFLNRLYLVYTAFFFCQLTRKASYLKLTKSNTWKEKGGSLRNKTTDTAPRYPQVEQYLLGRWSVSLLV